MDNHAAVPIRTILLVVGGVLALLVVIAGVLWASDYGLEATVVDKECGNGVLTGASSSQVTVKTKLLGIEHTVRDFPDAQCQGLRTGSDGNFVRYHLRSGHTLLFDREGGACIWDSEKGLGC